MDEGPLAVLTEDVFDRSGVVAFSARRTRFMAPVWLSLLMLTNVFGRAARVVLVDGAGVTTLAVAFLAVLLGLADGWTVTLVVAGGWGLAVLVVASLGTRQRVLIGEFRNMLEPSTDGASDQGVRGTEGTAVHLGDLLLGEISRLVDLFQVVGDRRAVSSGLGPERAFDATMSADGLLGTLKGAVSPDSKVSVGPVTLPIAPFVALFGSALRAPRLTGGLHRDGNSLILTAEMSRRRGLTWIVTKQLTETGQGDSQHDEAPAPNGSAGQGDAIVTAMVRQLATRIFTDVALGRSVRWNATESFVKGLQAFRVCLRTPRDRKVNLKAAQGHFLRALAEDEDFPLVHYNLGVVYTELHGLAVAGGRDNEAAEHLRAAETAFGRAIEKDPTRWETYFAYAQTQYRYRRYERVVEIVKRIGMLSCRGADSAKVAELEARALMMLGSGREANRRAREASQTALLSLAGARLLRRGFIDAELDRESRCRELAAGCLLTYGNIYSTQMTPAHALPENPIRRWWQDRILRRAQSIFKVARSLTRRGADMRFEFGLRALRRERFEVALEELEAAARSEPSRPVYLAGLALAQARGGGPALSESDRARVVELCWDTLEALAGAYNPPRDGDACGIVALAFDALGEADRAEELRKLAGEVRAAESRARSEEIISGYFLRALKAPGGAPGVLGRGHYVCAIASARRLLASYSTRAQASGSPNIRSPLINTLRRALLQADRATSLNPLSALAWETLGDVYRALFNFTRARESWENALATDPDNPSLYNKIGWSYWYPAFEKAAQVSPDDLEKAAEQFGNALLLYGSESFNDQVLTHYRLGKLKAHLRKFADARSELRIVDGMGKERPVVGWVQLGLAYLERDQYPECEQCCNDAAAECDRLSATGRPANLCVGLAVDEATWPLGVVRAWAHLGVAFSLLKRDGDLEIASGHVTNARKALDGVDLALHRSRAPAACDDADGLIAVKRHQIDHGIEKLRSSLNVHPFSAVYLHLALALAERDRADTEEAKRLVRHARTLRPPGLPTRELDEAERALSLAGNGNGAGDT